MKHVSDIGDGVAVTCVAVMARVAEYTRGEVVKITMNHNESQLQIDLNRFASL
jgi:hypothetical protein